MAAADITSTLYKSRTQGLMPINLKVTKVTQADWINIAGVRGVWPPMGNTVTVAANVAETFTYGAMTINNGGTAYTATSTSIVVQTAVATRKAPYYVATGSGEIMEVTTDSTPTATTSTLTVRRGVLGTTASATGLANTNVVAVLNQLILGSATVGPTFIRAQPMVGEPTPTDTYSTLSG
ncbi:hypothetical protein CCP3SC15_420023 [Gammaproteobacteria bacterium]